MAKNYDLFLERMKQKYNVPQQSQQNQNILQQQNVLNKNQDIYYNPSKAEQPQVQEEKNDFQKLNLWNKIGAGYHQARTSFETSFLDLGEGVIDAILTGVGAVGDWVGADGLSDTMNDWVKAEWLSALPEKDWFNDYFGLDFLFSEEAQEVGRKDEALPEIVDQVSSGIGSAVGYGLLNMVPVVGPALAWMGGGGAAAEQALNEGASNTEAMLYGGAVGGVEFATEKFLGKGLEKVGLGLGKFAGFGKGTSTTAKQVGKSAMSKIVSNVGKNFFEEGMEEVVSEIVDPLIKKGTYKRDENLKELYGEQISVESLAETFLIGGLTGGIFEGANIAGGIAKSGGVKNWDIRQEAQQLQIINSQMEQAILEGDEQKLKQLQIQKENAIKQVEGKFNDFVEQVKTNPRLGKIVSQATYEAQRDITKEDLILDATKKVFNAKSKKDGTPKINVEFSETDANGVQEPSHYSKKDNTIYLNKQSLDTLQTALETITHETGHAIHTSGLNTNFVNQMLTDFTDFDSLIDNVANKGTVTNVEEMISYYETQKGFGKILEDSSLLKQRMQEKKISKEQAYKELRNDYMLEEIANDIFSKKYFNNLLELQAVISGAKPNKIRKIKEAYRKRFANTPNKPSNYKEVMQIFNDGINQNYDNYKNSLVDENVVREDDIRYKLSEEETQPIINEDYDANKNSKFTVNDEEFNIKGISWYEKQLEKLDKINEQYDNEEISENSYYNKTDKINEQVENEINNIEYCLQEFERFDLEEEIDINELPTKKEIEKLLNYVYQIENYINNYMDEYDITDADFREYFDDESAIMQTYKYLSDNKTVENKLKEALKKEPKEKPTINEEEKIKVSKFKSTIKNAYNYFETLLEKYGDVYSAFDEMSGRYNLQDWELSFINEALYQNGKITKEDRDVIVDYLKIGNLSPYNEYQRYLNDGIPVGIEEDDYYYPTNSFYYLNDTFYVDYKTIKDIQDYVSKNDGLFLYDFLQWLKDDAIFNNNNLKNKYNKDELTQEELDKIEKDRNDIFDNASVNYDLFKTDADGNIIGNERLLKLERPNPIETSQEKETPKTETKKVEEQKPSSLLDTTELDNFDLSNYETKEEIINIATDVTLKIEKLITSMTEDAKIIEDPKVDYETSKKAYDDYIAKIDIVKKWKSKLKNTYEKMKNQKIKSDLVFEQVVKNLGKNSFPYKDLNSITILLNGRIDWNSDFKKALTDKKQGNIKIEETKEQENKNLELKDRYQGSSNRIDEFGAKSVRNKYFNIIEMDIKDLQYDKSLLEKDINDLKDEINEITYKNYKDKTKLDSIDEKIKSFENTIKEIPQKAKQVLQKTGVYEEFGLHKEKILKEFKEIEELLKDYEYETITTRVVLSKIDASIDKIELLLDNKDYGDNLKKMGLTQMIDTFESSITKEQYAVKEYAKETIETFKKDLQELDNKLENFASKRNKIEQTKVAQELKPQAQKTKQDYLTKLKPLQEKTNVSQDSQESKDLLDALEKEINSINYTNFEDVDKINKINDDLRSLEEKISKEVAEAEELKKQKELEEELKKQDELEENTKEEKEPKTSSKKENKIKEKAKEFNSNLEKSKIIRETRIRYTEGAKSIKETADATQMVKYTKTACDNLLDLVKEMILNVGGRKKFVTKLWFKEVEGGRNQIRDEMFEAFNTLGNNPKQLAEKLIELIKKGIYVQVQDFTLTVEPNKVDIKNQSRQTFMLEDMAGYSKSNTNSLFKIIDENLTSMIDDAIKNSGKPTALAKRIAEKTENMQKQIDALQKEIETLRNKIDSENKVIKVETEKATNNDEIKKVNKKISENNKRINALEKKLGEMLPKKQKVIDELKSTNKTLKENLKTKSKEVSKLTKEKIAAETKLKGVYEFKDTQANYLQRTLNKFFGFDGKLDDVTYQKVAEKFNNGDMYGVAQVLIDFLKDKEVNYTYQDYNEDYTQIIEVTEKVPFTTAYPKGVNDLLLEGLAKQIKERMENKRTTKRSPLPQALEKIKELKEQIKVDKEKSKSLNNIKSKLHHISSLSQNKRKSLLSNNIDKRFKAFGKKLGTFAKARILNGDFRQTLLEFKEFLTEEKFDGKTFQQITGIELPQQIIDKIDELQNLTSDVNAEELKLYEEILDAIEAFIEKGTGARLTNFVKGKDANGNNIYYTVEEFAEEAIKEQEEIIQKLGISKEKFRKILQTVDPRVVFKILSGFNENSKLYMLFEELQKGDTKTMEKYMELRKDLDDFNKQNKKFKKKVLKEKIIINDVKATKGEFISIYKSLNRDAAKKHILKNGFIVGGTKYRFSGEQEINDLYNAIETTLELKNKNSLMAKYYELTTKFFEDAGKAKAEIDRLLYGFADIEQGEYFPIHINSLDFNRTLGDKQYVSKMAASFNYSWQKAVVGDGGALAIDNVQDIIDVHSKQVADYYGYGVPLDQFNQLYSFKLYDEQTKTQKSLKETINNRFGYDNKSKKYLVEDYLKVLFDDIRGINTYSGESDKVFKKAFSSLRKKYSTYVLGANLKTAVVQLGAIPGAYKYISLKNMFKALKPFNKAMREKYPLPTLGKYRTYDKTILQSQTLNDEVGNLAEKFGILMTKTDQATIKFAWKAALYETANADGTFNEDKATKLFEKLVRETQPQYSAIERSALMRSKNDLVKLFTQFQSQSNKNFSTMVEVVYKAIYYKKMGMELSKQDKMMFYKATVSVATQGVFAVAIAYLFKFLLNDLDEEDKEPLAVISNFINETILGIVPLMNNIRVDLTGNGKFFKIIDFYEPSLGMIDKLSDALTDIGQLANPDKTTPSKIYDTVNAFGMVLGIPTENIYKYSMGILKWVFPNKAFTWDATTKNISMANKSEINDALKEGKVNVAKQYYDTYTSNILELDDKTMSTLFNLYKEGYTNAYIKQIPKTLVIDNEQVKVDRKEFLKTYSQLTPKLKQVVNSQAFNSLTKEEKEKVISKLVNTYYSLSKKEIIGDEEYSDIELLVKYNKNFNHKNIAYLVHISNIEETKTKTRKEMVQKYINSLPLSAGEKYLLYVLSGYSISDKNTKILRSFLSASGMPKKQINILLE